MLLARRVWNAKLRALEELEFCYWRGVRCSSLVCKFVCEVHGDVLARPQSNKLPSGAVQIILRHLEHAKTTAEHLQRAL